MNVSDPVPATCAPAPGPAGLGYRTRRVRASGIATSSPHGTRDANQGTPASRPPAAAGRAGPRERNHAGVRPLPPPWGRVRERGAAADRAPALQPIRPSKRRHRPPPERVRRQNRGCSASFPLSLPSPARGEGKTNPPARKLMCITRTRGEGGSGVRTTELQPGFSLDPALRRLHSSARFSGSTSFPAEATIQRHTVRAGQVATRRKAT